MGKLALAAKITHVPSMYLSELPGKNHGCRQAAIDGHIEIGKRCREMGVDTIIVFDTHWLVNSAYHINCADHFQGVYTSNELPHFIRDMTYDYDGNPELGHLIADEAVKLGVRAKAHNIPSLKLEYGTLVPMRYMNSDKHFKVVSISAFCTVHDFADSRRLGEAILKAIEKYDGTVAVFASGSLSHRFIDDQRAEEGMNSYTREFDHQMDERVVKLWREGKFKEFCTMLPDYGALLDDMFFHDGGDIPTDRFIVPRIEVELAFVLAKPLRGPHCTLFDVYNATDYVIPALELIDARSHNIDPETQRPRKVFDTISDNAANAGVILGGRPIKPDELDLRWISALLYRNGVIEETGVAAGVLNHPANGVAWLANKLAPYDVQLEAGQIILGGSFTRPVPARKGDTFHVDYGNMGAISCRFV